MKTYGTTARGFLQACPTTVQLNHVCSLRLGCYQLRRAAHTKAWNLVLTQTTLTYGAAASGSDGGANLLPDAKRRRLWRESKIGAIETIELDSDSSAENESDSDLELLGMVAVPPRPAVAVGGVEILRTTTPPPPRSAASCLLSRSFCRRKRSVAIRHSLGVRDIWPK
jgi:hypothetical protein